MLQDYKVYANLSLGEKRLYLPCRELPLLDLCRFLLLMEAVDPQSLLSSGERLLSAECLLSIMASPVPNRHPENRL